MNSKKIWHSFLLIFIYLSTVSLLVYLSALLFRSIDGGCSPSGEGYNGTKYRKKKSISTLPPNE